MCLHKKYCSLAKTLGCESYWMDSTCIPDDEQLRTEAIKSINSIFRDSKVTLISDQDIQSVSIDNSSIEELETLLSVLLVCDWGVRAWTMLEAIRGNTSIQILCKDDNKIVLKESYSICINLGLWTLQSFSDACNICYLPFMWAQTRRLKK